MPTELYIATNTHARTVLISLKVWLRPDNGFLHTNGAARMLLNNAAAGVGAA